MARLDGEMGERLKQLGVVQGARRAVRHWQGHDEIEYRQVEALANLHSLLRPTAPLPSTRGWAASPDVLLYLAQDILTRRPTVVVEFGSGTSSVVMGLALVQAGGGRLVSFDHDEQWAQRTRDVVAAHGLGDVVTVAHAPLTPTGSSNADAKGRHPTWYGGVEVPDGVGLVFVDGPPSTRDPHARQPVLAAVRPHLLPGAKVVLDDADRSGEREIVRRWCAADQTLTSTHLPAEKGIAVVEVRAAD